MEFTPCPAFFDFRTLEPMREVTRAYFLKLVRCNSARVDRALVWVSVALCFAEMAGGGLEVPNNNNPGQGGDGRAWAPRGYIYMYTVIGHWHTALRVL